MFYLIDIESQVVVGRCYSRHMANKFREEYDGSVRIEYVN
jgi:hypothetical protein